MRESWKFIVLLAISYWLIANPAQALPEVKPTFPRLANYFLHWTISEQEARELAKFDLVILDAEVAERSRQELQLLRRLNPQALVLAYVPAAEVRKDVGSLQTSAPLRYKLGAQLPEQWYLHDAQGQRRSFWPGTWIMDLTGPWSEHLAQFVVQEILSTGLWDGVFYDNAWDDIVHFARGVPDLNRDGVADEVKRARQLWQAGVRDLYRRTSKLAPDKLVLENDGPMYAPEVHGVLLESFPRKGFTRHVEELKKVQRETKAPKAVVLNANTFNTGGQDNFKALRYGLTTALLYNAYYSFDFGDQDHGQTWWYDEYGTFLGEPIEPVQNSPTQKFQSGKPIWIRDFENGLVLVNPNDVPGTVTLPIEVEKLRGVQDPLVNNGEITRELTVGSQDGLLVLRPLQIITGAPFENGIFARVLNSAGQPVRAGFFALDKQESRGITLAIVDLDGDGRVEKLRLSLGSAQGLALGDVTGEGVQEIVRAEAGQVRVERKDGLLLNLPFFPFGPQYRGALSVAVGDLNGDGFSEIVVGAGPGGGPQVRIFSRQGRLLSGGFFAYDPRFRGGVHVAVGDLDGDGKAEIVTGPGPGGGPQVRIFNAQGQAQGAGWFAFDKASRAGVVPLVTDLEGDGRNEIVALTKEVL